MSMLLEDLAEETSASNRRAADRLDAEARSLDEMRRVVAALEELRQRPTGDDAERLLFTLLSMFESDLRLVRSARALWAIAGELGADPEPQDELDRAEKRFQQLAAEVRRALEHRADDWQPADPGRLEQGLQLTREGKTVPADEARTWFRRGTDQTALVR